MCIDVYLVAQLVIFVCNAFSKIHEKRNYFHTGEVWEVRFMSQRSVLITVYSIYDSLSFGHYQ